MVPIAIGLTPGYQANSISYLEELSYPMIKPMV